MAAGTVEPAVAGSGNVCLGVFQGDYDNTNSLSPAPVALIETGMFSFFQTGTTITKSNIGQQAFVADDQTVTLDPNGSFVAGTIVDIDDDGTSVIVSMTPLNASQGTAIQSRSFEFIGGVSSVAGVGTGADTNGTARVYNIGPALPAGAQLRGYMGSVKVTAVGNTTLTATIGTTGAATEVATALDLMGTVGYTVGTAGAKKDAKPTAPQLLLTVTPDVGSKVSQATVGDFAVIVWFVDGTGI